MSGNLNHSPAEIIQYYLEDQGLGSFSGTWPIFATLMPDSPDNAICVYDTEGKIDGREHVSGETQKHHGIQVRIRSLSHTTGWQKAMAIATKFDAMHRAEVPIASDTYNVQSISLTSDILPLGLDEAPGSRRRSFVINALVSVRALAGTG